MQGQLNTTDGEHSHQRFQQTQEEYHSNCLLEFGSENDELEQKKTKI